tara:strand:+ start:3643 stop:4008 length:366 start_codon:yes stop_codon:yes gene_type:complete
MIELHERVVEWGYEKEIIQKGNVLSQAGKVKEEAGEVIEAVDAWLKELLLPAENRDYKILAHVMEEIGDLRTTLILENKMVHVLCSMLEVDPDECLLLALHKIEKRTGKIVDGVFVKSEDL